MGVTSHPTKLPSFSCLQVSPHSATDSIWSWGNFTRTNVHNARLDQRTQESAYNWQTPKQNPAIKIMEKCCKSQGVHLGSFHWSAHYTNTSLPVKLHICFSVSTVIFNCIMECSRVWHQYDHGNVASGDETSIHAATHGCVFILLLCRLIWPSKPGAVRVPRLTNPLRSDQRASFVTWSGQRNLLQNLRPWSGLSCL